MTATAPRFGLSPVRQLLAATVLIGTLIGALLAGASPASAHAALTGSNPKDGAVVATAPKEVTLTFSEEIAMGDDSIRVLEPSGKRADQAKVRDLGSGGAVVYGVDLRPELPNGTYTVAWQAVSADSHPVSGAFTFSIGAPSKTTVALPSQEAGEGLVGLLYDVARYASYAGFILLVGGAAFVLICWRRGASVRALQRLVVQGWLALTAGTLALLLLRTPYTGSGKLADAFDLGGLQDVLETKTGAALVSRLLLLGAAALFVAVLFGAYAKGAEQAGAEEQAEGADDADGAGAAARAQRNDLTFGLTIGGTVVAAGIAATWALSEHASTGIQTGLAMPMDVLHLLAVATWLGGLAALLTALYGSPSIERAAVRTFSKVALSSVSVLAATGLYQAWRQVGSWSALTGTPYGQLLLVKIGLVLVMVSAAWVSRRWTGRLAEVAEAESEAESEAVTVPEDSEKAEKAKESKEAAEPGKSSGTSETEDPVRVAQLARQQAAVVTAEKKKVKAADPERSGLRRSVLAEASVAIALLAVVTVLTSTEPGRTEEEAAKAGGSAQAGAAAPAPTGPTGPTEITLPFDTGGQNGKGTVRLTLDPATTGANVMDLWLTRPDGKPLDVPEVKVSFTLTAKQIGPLPITPTRIAAGHWSADPVLIPIPDEWRVQVTVRTSDIDQTTVDKNIKIG